MLHLNFNVEYQIHVRITQRCESVKNWSLSRYDSCDCVQSRKAIQIWFLFRSGSDWRIGWNLWLDSVDNNHFPIYVPNMIIAVLLPCRCSWLTYFLQLALTVGLQIGVIVNLPSQTMLTLLSTISKYVNQLEAWLLRCHNRDRLNAQRSSTCDASRQFSNCDVVICVPLIFSKIFFN